MFKNFRSTIGIPRFLSWLWKEYNPQQISVKTLLRRWGALSEVPPYRVVRARARGRESRPNILARTINSPRGKGAARILPKILHTDYLSAAVAARRAIRRLVRSIVAYKSCRFVCPRDSRSINRPAIETSHPFPRCLITPSWPLRAMHVIADKLGVRRGTAVRRKGVGGRWRGKEREREREKVGKWERKGVGLSCIWAIATYGV